MTAIDVTPDRSLSALLRSGTRVQHREAESSRFMSELLAGRVDEDGYAHYLGRLRQVYEALESTACTLADDRLATAVIDPVLDRLAAIDADIAFWGSVTITSAATDAYVDRIRATASWGGLFVAHHYTRYLGDLSGGRAIGRTLTREFALAGRGVAFYDFAEVPSPKSYKGAYRARLDALPLDAAERGRVLDEVKVAFALNGALFAELSGRLGDYGRD